MEMNEKLFDAVGMIGGRHIEEALSFEPGKEERRCFPMRLIYAAAACLLLFAAGFGMARLNKRSGSEEGSNGILAAIPSSVPTETFTNTASPTAAPTAQVTARPAYVNGKKVVYGENGMEEAAVTNRGEVDIPWQLKREAEKEENADCLFAVEISLSHTGDELLEELEAEFKALCDTPEMIKYTEMYDKWQEDMFGPFGLDAERACAHYGLSYDEFWQTYGHNFSVGQMLMFAEFEDYLKTHIDEDEYAECIAAHERYVELLDEKWGPRTLFTECYDEAIRAECERLKALGYDVEIMVEEIVSGGSASCTRRVTCCYGFLTPEQLLDFPVTEEYGYNIKWQGHSFFEDA